MKEFLLENWQFILWGVVTVLALGLEAATAELVSCWFAPSALVCMILSPFVKNIWIELIIFFALSILLLAVGRSFVKKRLANRKSNLNADRLIGETGVVKEAIDNLAETGAVKIEGLVWTARSTDGSKIPEGSIVIIREIQGVKLICELNKK